MKKIFTLLFAATLALGVSAQAFNRQDVKFGREAAPVAEKPVVKVPAKQVGQSFGSFDFNAVPQIRRSAAATQGAIAPAMFVAAYYGSYSEIVGDWFINLYDASQNWIGELDFMSGSATAIAGSYTCDTASYKAGTTGAGYGYFVNGADTLAAYNGSFSIAYSKNSNGYLYYNLSGSVTLTDGTPITFDGELVCADAYDYYYYYIYQMGYGSYFDINSEDDCLIDLEDAPFTPTGNTIYCNLGRAKTYDYTADYGEYEFYANDASAAYKGALDVYTTATSPVGTYGADDIDMDYTMLYQGSTKIALKYAISADITAGTADTVYNIHAQLMGKDGNIYDITMKDYLIHAMDTIVIDVPAAKIYDGTANGVFQVYGYNAAGNYYASATFNGNSLAGTYTQDDAYYYNGANYTYLVHIVGSDTTYIEFDNQFTYSGTLNGTALTATLEGLGEDAHYYIVNYTGDTASALDDVAAEQKAIKVIENGKMYIYKEGHKYDAQGIMLK